MTTPTGTNGSHYPDRPTHVDYWCTAGCGEGTATRQVDYVTGTPTEPRPICHCQTPMTRKP